MLCPALPCPNIYVLVDHVSGNSYLESDNHNSGHRLRHLESGIGIGISEPVVRQRVEALNFHVGVRNARPKPRPKTSQRRSIVGAAWVLLLLLLLDTER